MGHTFYRENGFKEVHILWAFLRFLTLFKCGYHLESHVGFVLSKESCNINILSYTVDPKLPTIFWGFESGLSLVSGVLVSTTLWNVLITDSAITMVDYLKRSKNIRNIY